MTVERPPRIPRRGDRNDGDAKPLWVRKSRPPSLEAAQRFERDALAALKRAGASDQIATALISASFSAVAAGNIEDLDDALDQAVAEVGGALVDAWTIDTNRAEALGVLAEQHPEPETPMGNPTAADPAKEIVTQTTVAASADAQLVKAAAELRKQLPELSDAQARTRVLKSRPELYAEAMAGRAPALDAATGEGSVADYVDAALAVEMKKRLDAGVPLGIATRGLFADQPELAQLAELCRLYPADAAQGIVEGSARLHKHRPDVNVVALVKAAVADPEVIVRVAKKRGQGS